MLQQPKNVQIRECPDNLALQHQLIQLFKASFASPSEQWNLKQISNFCAYGHIGVLMDRTQKLYASICYLQDCESVEIISLATHPDYRRRGYASYLLEHFLRRWEDIGVRSVMLMVRSSNNSARELYAQHGFHEVTQVQQAYTRPHPENGVRLVNLLD